MSTPDTWQERLFSGVCNVGCLEGWGGWTARQWRLRAFLERHPDVIPATAGASVRRAMLRSFLYDHPKVMTGRGALAVWQCHEAWVRAGRPGCHWTWMVTP